MPPMSNDPRQILEQTFGYRSFRGPQEAVIRAVVAGEDALLISEFIYAHARARAS